MPQALKPLCLVDFWSLVNSLFSLLALWGKRGPFRNVSVTSHATSRGFWDRRNSVQTAGGRRGWRRAIPLQKMSPSSSLPNVLTAVSNPRPSARKMRALAPRPCQHRTVRRCATSQADEDRETFGCACDVAVVFFGRGKIAKGALS